MNTRNTMPPMTIPTKANNKKIAAQIISSKQHDFCNKKMARVDDRTYIYVPADATKEEVAALVEKAKNKIHHLKK